MLKNILRYKDVNGIIRKSKTFKVLRADSRLGFSTKRNLRQILR